MALAPGGIGPEIVRPLIESKEILELSDDVIKPYYYKKITTGYSFFTTKNKDT